MADEANYVVKNHSNETIYGEFDSYDQAVAFYRVIVLKHPGAVIKDNSRGKR